MTSRQEEIPAGFLLYRKDLVGLMCKSCSCKAKNTKNKKFLYEVEKHKLLCIIEVDTKTIKKLYEVIRSDIYV